jgi:hypothetical protein
MTKNFDLTRDDLKQYPHFDAPISLKNIKRLVTSPDRVAKNSFYPLFLYHKSWQPFRLSDPLRPPKKIRPIRYGARRDAYIFLHYRNILSDLYEKKLHEMGISLCPVAYRKIKRADGRGKCNIDFAKDAFDTIDSLGNCVAICLDIKGYFESLDHIQIKKIWCDLLGVNKLPSDHYAVFKNITQYRYVDQKSVYTRLGYWGVLDPSKPLVEGLLKEIPTQICTPQEFREKICGLGGKSGPSLIEKNVHDYGIPQGAPISDIIANFYLLDFDKKINDFAKSKGGKYLRYSDDILIILPNNSLNLTSVIALISNEISKNGKNLSIKKEKTSIVEFSLKNGTLSNQPITYDGLINNKDGLEYLGFRYDGRNVYVRESTVSRLFRKISTGAKKYAKKYVKDNPGKDIPALIDNFNFSIFYQKYGKVNKKDYAENNYKSWTFHSYIKRSCDVFGKKGKEIRKQFSNFQTFSREKISKSIVVAWNKENDIS